MAKLTAMLKKTEMKASSLERTVDQKNKENEELTTICDDLIAKVGCVCVTFLSSRLYVSGGDVTGAV